MTKAKISPTNTLLLLIGICLLFTVINAAGRPRPSCIWNCEGIKDGHYQSCDPKIGCNRYVSCVARRKMYIRRCPASLVWDDRLRRCETVSTTCDYQRPNIIYLMADDAGLCDVGFMHDHVDCTGAVGVRTPHLDKLANDGRILTNHYMMPGCTPSRHAFLTGRYPHNSQMQNFILPSSDPHCIPTNIKLLPEHLKDQGYATHATGKWHVGYCKEECLPTSRGFDSFYGLYTGMAHQYTHVTQPPDVPLYDFRDNTVLDKTANGTHSTTLFTDQSVRLIKAHDKYKPMFLFVAYTAPHHPFQVPDEYLDQFTDPDMHEDRKRVLAMMLQLDDGARSIVKALKKQGMWDNTFLIFSSDNGGDVLSHQYNGPIRGAKGTLYEGGTRAAAFVHGKMVKTMKDIETSDGLMHVTDWFASIISIAQGNANAVNGIDQTDMLLKGKSSKRSDMFYNIDMEAFKLFGQAAVRHGDMKLIWGYQGTYEGWGWNVTHMADFPENLALFPPHLQTPDNLNARNGALMGMRTFEIDADGNITTPGAVSLFDLAADPNEMNNLADDEAYSSTIITLQNMIINEILNNYVKPQPLHLADWTAVAVAAAEDGSWATGWCDNVTITV